jgi:hypothetical protein
MHQVCRCSALLSLCVCECIHVKLYYSDRFVCCNAGRGYRSLATGGLYDHPRAILTVENQLEVVTQQMILVSGNSCMHGHM